LIRAKRSGFYGSIPGEETVIFSLLHCEQQGSGAHPAYYPMGKRSSFLCSKAAVAWS